MTQQWHGQPCPICGLGLLQSGTKLVHQSYKGVQYSSETRGAFCNHCEDGFPEYDPNEETQWMAFRKEVDAQHATELARIRKKLGLTQSQAAQIAGGGKNAFSRYERGQAKPVSAVIYLFRLLDKHPELLGELRQGSKA